MKIRYSVEYRVATPEPDDVVPWTNMVFRMTEDEAMEALGWYQEHHQVTTINQKLLVWRVVKITEELVSQSKPKQPTCEHGVYLSADCKECRDAIIRVSGGWNEAVERERLRREGKEFLS